MLLQNGGTEWADLFKYIIMPITQGFILFAFTKALSLSFGLACMRESPEEELVAGHDKGLLGIMTGTEIRPEMYKHNRQDDKCKKCPEHHHEKNF